ncbi:hypothetical protein FGG08_004962 [Glutinoglossum americanum]|uniref:Uncharacterized protein n=1 Tax=Glutinoglossum americanum TaxID=1670608 RepID=A0A9P8I867_9PEZI|nr:hypothetical protein FGG08_004962 [Glutinoglossum americanum]
MVMLSRFAAAVTVLFVATMFGGIGEGLVIKLPADGGVKARAYHGGGGAEIPLAGKVSYVIVILVALPGLIWCLGRRIVIIRRKDLHDTPFIRWLVIIIYVVGILFVLSSTLLQYGFGLNVVKNCRAAIILCLVFYLGAKVLMYIFFVERARLMCLPVVQRKYDKVWWGNMIMVVAGFGVIAVLSFVYLVTEVSPVDGQCRIGLRLGVTVALLAYDMIINVWLTGLFIKLAAQYMKKFFPDRVSKWWEIFNRKLRPREDDISMDKDDAAVLPVDATGGLAKLARKTMIGCTVMLSSTIVNLAVLLRFHGHEAGWVCFLVCTIDGKDAAIYAFLES